MIGGMLGGGGQGNGGRRVVRRLMRPHRSPRCGSLAILARNVPLRDPPVRTPLTRRAGAMKEIVTTTGLRIVAEAPAVTTHTPILLVHGMAAGAWHFERWQPFLAARGW